MLKLRLATSLKRACQIRQSSAWPRAGAWTISGEPAPLDNSAAVAALRTADAVRERCTEILSIGERDELEHFVVQPARLREVAAYVAGEVRTNYPDLNIPYHSRWRHFSAGGLDRWGALARELVDCSADEIARIRLELAITSVLLDAGAGDRWRYHERCTGDEFTRSEGLAVASFDLYKGGAFSARPETRLRADGEVLRSLDQSQLQTGFQVSADNPLVGIEGRARLLRGLGAAVYQHPDVFGHDTPRVGNLYDYLAAKASGGRLQARTILETVLYVFGSIWPGRLEIGGVNLGDVWCHSALRRTDSTDTLIPLHKLSQWLTYSLAEPLEEAGIVVVELDALTGLGEYRNGGLFVDLDALEARDPASLRQSHDISSELIVEWRALTVALLDRLAPLVRAELGLDDETLPLAKVLEGGTWSAGRRIAQALRADARPPFNIESDGTVF